ncbi:MAG: response regulator [Gemmataceae bacterium]
MKPIRVLIVDDHALVRAGIRSLLKELTSVEVIGEASNGREALTMLETHHPDVVLMDIMMPELNGLDATARICAAHPRIRVIILSMNATEEYVLQSLRAGAAGYLLKDISPSELEQAIRAVAQGESYLTSAVSKHVVAGLLQRADPGRGSLDRLTPRQREVLQLIAEGNTTKQIARKLGISVKTAETHRMQLMDSLDIHDVAGLVRYAVRMGVITPEM